MEEMVVPMQPAALVMFSDSEEYRPTDDSIDSITKQMLNGAIVSLSLRPKSGSIRYGLVNAPFFAGTNRSGCFGTIEYLRGDYEAIWASLLASSELQVACIGMEEGLELTDETASVSTFPWN